MVTSVVQYQGRDTEKPQIPKEVCKVNLYFIPQVVRMTIKILACFGFLQHYVISLGGGRVLTYFAVWGRAAEQGIIFRIPNPGQSIIIVKIGSTTGSIFVFFDSETWLWAICTPRT